MSLAKLPPEMILHICKFLNKEERVYLSLVSTRLLRIISYDLRIYNIEGLIMSFCNSGKFQLVRYISIVYPIKFRNLVMINPWPYYYSLFSGSDDLLELLLKNNCKRGYFKLHHQASI